MLIEKKVPLYGWEFAMSDSREDSKAYLESHDCIDSSVMDQSIEGIAIRVYDASGESWRLMGVFNHDIGTVAHEALHTAYGMCSKAGLKVSQGNDETLAYMVGWLVSEFIKTFPNHKWINDV